MSAADVSDLLLEGALVVYAATVIAYLAEILLGSRVQRPRCATLRRSVRRSAGQQRPRRSTATAAETRGRRARGDRFGRMALALMTMGVLFHLGAVVARGFAAGRAPWGNMFEFATVGALVAAGAFLVLQRRFDVAYLGVWVSAVVLGVLGFAVTVLYTEAGPLLPALRSTWLVIHVLAAITATGLFTLGALTSLLFLLADRLSTTRGRLGAYVARLPDRDTLDRLAFRLHAVAFPIWTFAVMAGAIWAQYAWGRYWGWDPKETWAFVSWVVYAAYLHARVTAGWKGRAAAAVALVGYGTMLFNFIGVNIFFSGFHSYAGL